MGNGLALFERLGKMPVKLGNISHIFVGTQTSADDIFVLEDCRFETKYVIGNSKSLNKEVRIEAACTVPFLRGKEIRRYKPPKAEARVICPMKLHKKVPGYLLLRSYLNII